jgi:hypothetical protein
VYLAYRLHYRRSPISRVGELREALRAFINSCESTSLLIVAPEYELWEMGFKTLEEIRDAVVECSELYTHTPEKLVPIKIKSIINGLRRSIEELYMFRDSFIRFAKGRPITSQTEIAKWRDFERAKHALSIVQTDYRGQKDELKAFLSKLDSK